MKKQMSLGMFFAATLFAVGQVSAEVPSYEESVMETSYYGPSDNAVVVDDYAPAMDNGTETTVERYEVRTYDAAPQVMNDNSYYYSNVPPRQASVRTYRQESGYARPQQASYSNRSQMYRGYNNSSRYASNGRTQTTTKKMKRKYYLAHPFFQPTEGKFGSITDFSYNSSSYDLSLTPYSDSNVTVDMSDTTAKWDMSQIALKEDFSYGITDEIAVLAMARYDITKVKFDWSTAVDDKADDSGLNLYGLGLQWRFTDTDEWIATLSVDYERQKDVANEFMVDVRAGYKVARSTIYGYGRGWLMDFDTTSYGNGVVNGDQWLYVAYDLDVDREFFFEGGLGVFSVLNKDWTFNLEASLGSYSWHNQGAIKGAFGWQPGDSFALNLYGRMAFYDSIENKDLNFFGTYDYTDPDTLQTVHGAGYLGKAKIDNYSEYSIGAQLIFLF